MKTPRPTDLLGADTVRGGACHSLGAELVHKRSSVFPRCVEIRGLSFNWNEVGSVMGSAAKNPFMRPRAPAILTRFLMSHFRWRRFEGARHRIRVTKASEGILTAIRNICNRAFESKRRMTRLDLFDPQIPRSMHLRLDVLSRGSSLTLR